MKLSRQLSPRYKKSDKKLPVSNIYFDNTKSTSHVTSTVTTMTTMTPDSIRAVVDMDLEQNSDVDEKNQKRIRFLR